MSIRSLRPLILCLALAAVSGCSGPIETRVRAQGSGPGETRILMWASPPEGETVTPQMTRARETLAAVLQGKGFAFAPEAPISVSLGLSERPADIALKAGGDASFSPAKDNRLLQSCRDRILRFRVVMIERTNGEIRYAGEAQEAHCRAGMDDVLTRLASLAIADIGRTEGERRVLTPGRD